MAHSKALVKLKKMNQYEQDKLDDETMADIEKRLGEIREMARPRKDPRKVIDRMEPEVRDRVLRVKAIPLDEFKRQKRKKWKLRDMFVWSIQMVRLLLKCFWSRKLYYIDKADMGQLRRKIEREIKSKEQSNQSLTPTSRSSIPAELEISLRNMPRIRSTTNIAQVLWLLRTTKAFKGLFPAEMEEQLATHVSYEKYDDGRIIACQSRTPDRFYYVLAGRVSVLRQFNLSTGTVTKHMCYLTKGNVTDPEEMEKQWMREDSLVAKGQVEVLLLEKEAFVHLQTTHKGPPVDFIKSVDLFESFEPEIFQSHPDAIEYKYYGQGKLVLKDSNRTAWLHLVKSGSVKVVRRQSVVDSVTSNSRKFSSRNAEGLGCEKYSSHAEAMLGVQAKQKKLQELRFSLPQGLDNVSFGNPFGHTLGVDVEGEEKVPDPPVIYRSSAKTHLQHFQSKAAMEGRRKTIADLNNPQLLDSDSEDEVLPGKKERKRKTSGTKLPVINIPMRMSAITPEQQVDVPNMWLTKERTEMMDYRPRKQKTELSFRRAYLQMDELKTGDVFGLDHLQPALASEPHGYSLVSNGAEIVKISKRFFLQHASNNSMMKVEIMYKRYLSEDEAKDRLYERETWGQYKSALWDRITEPLNPPNSVR